MNVRQFSYVLLFLLGSASILVQCNSTKAAASDLNTSSEAGLDMQAAVTKFIEVLKSGETKGLPGLLPGVDAARAIAPDETKELTDKEIEEQLLKGLEERFIGNLDNIWTAVDDLGSSPEDIRYSGYEVFPAEKPDMPFPVVNISFSAAGKTATIPVTNMEYEGSTYFMEILISTNLFK